MILNLVSPHSETTSLCTGSLVQHYQEGNRWDQGRWDPSPLTHF